MARTQARDRPRTGGGGGAASAAPVVPGFRLGPPLGFGARGPVWSATALPDGPVPVGRACAVSVLPRSGQDRDEQQRQRLTALVGRRHESLAEILAVVPLAEGTAVASERIDGPTLAVLRASRSGLTPGEVAALIRPLADGLARLHALGVTHGDVSPANVVLAGDRRPVLVDLAGDVAFEAGTAGFVSPERALGAPTGPSADVWSLAMIALWLADGADRSALQAALAPALTSDPRARCTASELGALSVRLAGAAPVVVPPPSSLAQGSLRARAAIEETRLAATRRRRAVRRGSGRHRRGWAASARSWRSANRVGLARPLRMARRGRDEAGPGRSRRPGPWLAVLLILVSAGGVGGTVLAERASRAQGGTGPERPLIVPAPSAGRPASVQDEAPRREAEVIEAVRELLAARDGALNGGDGRGLAALSVPGSPAAQADAALVDALAAGATDIADLETRISRLQVLAAADAAARVRVVSGQSAHVRTSADGPVHVPAQPERCADLELEQVGGSWLLRDVVACSTG